MHWARKVGAAAAVVLAGWLLGCDGSAPFDGGIDPPDPVCIDRDGDGYGVNCPLGLDCDDSDPSIHEACEGVEDPCAQPATGCPCRHEGATVECRTIEPVVSPDGSVLCYLGTRTCTDGAWGPCEGMEPYAPGGGASDGDGVQREAILGSPTACTGTCDPDCMYVHDCPSQPDLVPANHGNIIYDPINAPPAIVLQDLGVTGYFVRDIQGSCPRYDETFLWWGLDYDLRVEAPQTVSIRVRTADTEAGLAAAISHEVANCLGGPCALPTPFPSQQADRGYGNGVIHDAVGAIGARRQWLRIEVFLRANGAATSPRFLSTDLYFFCPEAT